MRSSILPTFAAFLILVGVAPQVFAAQNTHAIQMSAYGQLLTPATTPTPPDSPLLPDHLMFADSLTVLGDTILGKTTVAGGLAVDGAVQLSATGIQSIGSTLYIQNNKLAPINMMNGALLINTSGDVLIGNLIIEGVLGVDTITPRKANVTVRLASDSAHFDSFLINGGGMVVGSIDASGNAYMRGNIEASGSGIFRSIRTPTVETQTLTFTHNPAGQSVDSVGQSTIPAGYAHMTILNNLVTTMSRVFVSPVSLTTVPLSVSDLKPTTASASGSFTVELASPAASDINFNWFIVN